jgi:hypothetical protein
MTDDGAYWPSPWPGEDGGPRRVQMPHGIAGPRVPQGASLDVSSRELFGATMVVLRDPGEVYVHAFAPGGATSTLERVDPSSLTTVRASPDLPAGPWWPGGVAVHANGDLYVTAGRWCHRLDPDCALVASRELPRDRPYNSLVILPDGHLVMKDMVMDGSDQSRLVVLEPERLEPVGPEVDVTEDSIARISADGSTVYVVGTTAVHRFTWDGARLARDDGWRAPYLRFEGQHYGWDPVLTAGHAWFLDNGAGSDRFAGTFHGRGIATAPLHLVRAALDGDGRDVELVEICGEPGGIVVNPPLVDAARGIAVGFDSGNGVLAAFTIDAGGLAPRWRRDQDHGGHMLLWPDTGALVTYDHRDGQDHVVILDVETGNELSRAATGSAVQSVCFPAAGPDGDLYYCSLMTVAHVRTAGGR